MTPPMLQSSHYWSSLTSCANFRTQYCCPKSTRLIYTPVTRCSWWDSFKESAHEDRIESVARFGHISKPRTQARYTVDIEKKKNVTADAHLIEFSAWGGSSGSPVFINDASLHAPREDKFYEPPPQGMGYGIPPPIYLARHVRPPMIGMLHGDYSESGIGIVIPARAIMEALMAPPLQERRECLKADCENNHFRPSLARPC